MGAERAAHREAGPKLARRLPVNATDPLAATEPTNLADAVTTLQRLAGNRAVSEELAAVQRDETGGPDADTFKVFAQLWPQRVIGRLVEARENASGKSDIDLLIAISQVGDAYEFVLRVFNATPEADPVWVKLRILGRSIAGIYDALQDRNTKDKEKVADAIAEDLRSWRLQATELGPTLKKGPNGQQPNLDKWNDGVVFTLGRAILKTEQDVRDAENEASIALEIINMWHTAAPTGDPSRLQLASLERGVYSSWQRLRQLAHGSGEVNLRSDIDTAIAGAKVLEAQIASIHPPPPIPAAAPAPPKKPFVNDTELEKP